MKKINVSISNAKDFVDHFIGLAEKWLGTSHIQGSNCGQKYILEGGAYLSHKQE